MARIAPADRAELPVELEGLFTAMERAGNVVPNSMVTMARVPPLLQVYAPLNAAVYADGRVPADLKRLVAHVASRAAGCGYCAAHNALRASSLGIDEQKVEEIWEFESSARFTDAERAALRLAVAAAQVPNETSDELFATLRNHYDEQQILELVAVVAMVGFTNRWNETLHTDLEDRPLEFGVSHLASSGWIPGAGAP